MSIARDDLKTAEAFAEGVEHFNAARFWEAHESWEALWLEADAPVVAFYQGLIQLAAAYHHMQRGTFRGAGRLFAAALGRLAPFPSGFHDLDRDAAVRAAADHRLAAESSTTVAPEAFPKLTITSA